MQVIKAWQGVEMWKCASSSEAVTERGRGFLKLNLWKENVKGRKSIVDLKVLSSEMDPAEIRLIR